MSQVTISVISMSILKWANDVAYRFKERAYVMSFMISLLSIGLMSYVDFKNWPCRRVEFKSQGSQPWRRASSCRRSTLNEITYDGHQKIRLLLTPQHAIDYDHPMEQAFPSQYIAFPAKPPRACDEISKLGFSRKLPCIEWEIP